MERSEVLKTRSRSSQDWGEPRPSADPAHATCFQFGELTLDLLSACLQRGSERLAIEPRAFDVLVHLVRHAGAVVSREALLDIVWQDVNVAPHSLTQAILQVRQALGDNHRKPRFIETVHRRGYRFLAPVYSTLIPEPRHPSNPSLAVLPFVDMTDGRNHEWFADGITDELINALTRIPGLRVIARTSTFAFKNKAEDVRSIAGVLGVSHVLEGSVRKAGTHVRVMAQLINAHDGGHVWSDRYDAVSTKIFEVQEAVARAITDALEVKLSSPAPISRRGTANVAAYEAYLEASYHFSTGSIAEFKQCLDRTVGLDPGFALAYSLSGGFYTASSWLGLQSAHEAMPLARKLQLKALSLDPALAQAHAVLAVVAGQYDYDWKQAERQFRLAMAQSPVSGHILIAYGNHYLVPTGRAVEAVEALTCGLEADPLNPLGRHHLAVGLRHARRFDEAERELRRVLALNANHVGANGTLGAVCSDQGKLDEALAFTEKAHALAPQNPIFIGQLAALLRRTGDKSRAGSFIDQLRPGQAYGAPVGLALYHSMCAEMATAADWAARAIEQRFPPVVHILGPLMCNTASWPALARMMNLPPSNR